MKITAEYLNGYARYFNSFMEKGWRVYLLTLQYRHISGSGDNSRSAMHSDIDSVWKRFLPYVVRNPRRVSTDGKLPIMLAVPDFPVGKKSGYFPIDAVIPNAGLHVHAFLAVPPTARIFGKVVKHFKTQHLRYVQTCNHLASLHCKRLKVLNTRTVDYLYKNVKRGNVSLDDVQVFPKSRSELPDKRAR